MELLITRQTDTTPSLPSSQTRARLEASLQTLLRREGASADAEISLLLCDDDFIRGLNAEYRGQDKPTDVLSFAQDDPHVLGDIVISVPTAQRQADAAEWGLDSEFILLAVHGLLHLLGYDDETAAGAAEMQEKTVAALKDAGIALPEAGTHPFFVEYD